ncbi:MAG: HD domain-containing protein [Butyrivibrio sp.]|uniref:HD domain-containing protein n=1 Tax=Butyrivibrio sp. TaxID=28121 RepID=UPI001B1F6A73|nr:HD domain-containing protein [Butyrivibrio sp.]MBO6242579.1 HD domain-containing protein [Butyrivibrio sp.]
MDAREYLEILHVAERLKDTPRHCTTTKGRTESVAEHSWRISLMAFLLRHEFKDLDINKVVDMCLDKLEALIQHNESPLNTWSENEFELNKTYAFDTVAFSSWLTELRKSILEDTLKKIETES